jgi:hypothetical protein
MRQSTLAKPYWFRIVVQPSGYGFIIPIAVSTSRAFEITDHYKPKSDIPGIHIMTTSSAPFHKIRHHTKKFVRRTARGLTFKSASGRHGADPDFIIIGIQKGGTNAARYNLNRHPKINIVQDEVHYFDKKYYLPLWWYQNHFIRFEKNIINGEATPVYMRKRWAIDRIHKHYPAIKLIAMIREPIQRAFSKWSRVKLINDRREIPTKPFLSSVIEDDQHLLSNGFYYDQIEYIIEKFSRENIHIAISEQVLAEPAEQYNRMVRFLGLPAHDFEGLRRKHQTVYSVDLKHEDIKELYDIYRPHNEKLYELLGGRIEQWEDFYGSSLHTSRAGQS